MAYTTNGQPQGTAHSISNFIREAMIGELAAINDYTKHINETSSCEIKDILTHIMLDEKRHYGMLLELLRKFDCIQFNKAVKAKEEHENEEKKQMKKKVKTKNTTSSTNKKSHSIEYFLNKIRADIKSELAAIISYEDIISRISDKEAIDVITEITGDEKEHVEELTSLVQNLDKDCYGPIEKDFL